MNSAVLVVGIAELINMFGLVFAVGFGLGMWTLYVILKRRGNNRTDSAANGGQDCEEPRIKDF